MLPVSAEIGIRLPWVTVLLLAACAHTPSPPPRPPPLTGWRTLRTAHVRLRTDLPSADARTTAERLEILRAALQTAWSGHVETPGTTDAIVLRAPGELRTFTEWSGVATITPRGPLLVTAGSVFEFGDLSPDLPLLAHEMAHDLDHRRMPGAPRWFDEGLASYLESAELLDAGRVRFGAMGRADLEQARAEPLIPLDTVVVTRWESLDPPAVMALYRSARLWVQALRTEEADRMRALEAALAAGVPWRVAWADARRGLDVARLEEALHRWLRAGELPTELHRFAAPPTAVTEGPLPPWGVHVAQAELWAAGISPTNAADRTHRVRAELEAAATAAPEEPLPRVLLAELEADPDLQRAAAERLRQTYPRSPDAAVFLARVLRDQGGPVEGRRGTMLDAVALAPDDVDALTASALEEARAGDYGRAFAGLRRAETVAPWSPTVHLARASILASIGDCQEAADAVQRALDVLSDAPSPDEVAALVRERHRVQASCRAAARH